MREALAVAVLLAVVLASICSWMLPTPLGPALLFVLMPTLVGNVVDRRLDRKKISAP